ncbi:MAG: hypothetical protein HY319_26795 [Armatimonadetes bacterium]|nr:hypothetical protein [Armatimonadota bacterium]
MVPRLLAFAAAAGLAAWGLASGPARLDAPLVGLGLIALVLEWTAVALPGFGYLSPAPACYLALALLQRGFSATTLVAIVALGARSLRAQHAPERTWMEAVGDLIPALAAGAAAHLVADPWGAALAAGLVYFHLATLVPEALARLLEPPGTRFAAARYRALSFTLATGFSGIALAFSAGSGGAWVLWLPVIVSMRWWAVHLVGALEHGDSTLVGEKLAVARQHLERTHDSQERLRRDLHHKVEECSSLLTLAEALSKSPHSSEVLDLMIDVVPRLISCRSVVVFVAEDGRLRPVRWNSPWQQELKNYELLKLSEPIVEEAYTTGRLHLTRGAGAPRVFRDEPTGVAFPLGELGALYVGSQSRDPLTAEQLYLPSLLTGLATPALRAARRRELQEEVLSRQASAGAHLQESFHSLGLLLRCTRHLVACLDRDELVVRLEECLARLIPHSSRLLVLKPEVRRYWCEEGAGGEPLLEDLMEAVYRAGRPLVFEDMGSSPFGPLACGHASLLATPFPQDTGLVLLGAGPAGAFDRRHQELLGLLIYQASAVLEAVDAVGRLKESQAQLIQSSKLAAIGQLAAGVAHELNTPLGSIVLSLDSAQAMLSGADERVVQKLERASLTVVKARNIVEKLLYYSRDAGAGRQPTDLNAVVEDTLLLVAHPFRMDGVEVDKHLGELPPIECNQGEIQQVLMNLLVNARDALVELGGTPAPIEVTTWWEANHACLEVCDRGAGVAPEIASQIFDPFFTTKPIGEGTGLGLSISQQLVGQHDGTLTLHADKRGETRFRVRLPG